MLYALWESLIIWFVEGVYGRFVLGFGSNKAKKRWQAYFVDQERLHTIMARHHEHFLDALEGFVGRPKEPPTPSASERPLVK